MLTASDEFLMICFKMSGDPTAIRELHRRHVPAMKADLARFFGRNMGAIDDVIQIAFQHIFVNRASYKGEYNFAAWAYTILRHDAINHKKHLDMLRRRSSSLEEISAETEFEPVDHRGRSVSDEAVASETGSRIHAILDRLLPEDQVLLNMIHFQGASYDQAAKALNITVNATRVRLFRLLRSLRLKLACDKNLAVA